MKPSPVDGLTTSMRSRNEEQMRRSIFLSRRKLPSLTESNTVLDRKNMVSTTCKSHATVGSMQRRVKKAQCVTQKCYRRAILQNTAPSGEHGVARGVILLVLGKELRHLCAWPATATCAVCSTRRQRVVTEATCMPERLAGRLRRHRHLPRPPPRCRRHPRHPSLALDRRERVPSVLPLKSVPLAWGGAL